MEYGVISGSIPEGTAKGVNAVKGKSKKRSGFTMAEVLITIGIIAVLAMLAVGTWGYVQKNMRQKDLDSKAELLYTAIQNRLSVMYTGGMSAEYDPANYEDGSIVCMNDYPGDYDPDGGTALGNQSVWYFTSSSGDAFSVIMDEVLSDLELSGGHIVVEYIPYTWSEDGTDRVLTAAMVYAVYYSEDRIDVSTDYTANGGPTANDYYSRYRNRSKRFDDGARLGYYGGAAVSGTSNTSELSPTVAFKNEETLTALVKLKKSTAVTDPLLFTFVLTDAAGHAYTICYDEATGKYTAGGTAGAELTDPHITLEIIGQSYTFTFVLDDLSSESTRFVNLYGSGSDHENKLDAGTALTLSVLAACPTDRTVESGEASETDNSLFAASSSGNTAMLSCGRHLQNLDSASGVVSSVTSAVQTSNLSFGEDSAWSETYGEAYYNGMTGIEVFTADGTTSRTVPNFKCIENENLTSYSGQYSGQSYSIEGLSVTSENAGLFNGAGSKELTISSVILTGAHISGSETAGVLLAGVPEGRKVTVTGCQVYLDRDAGDIPSSISSDMNGDALYFVKAPVCGGLVGVNNGTLVISDSSVSTVLYGTGKGSDGISGGLVGENTGSVTVSGSYTDSYLYGRYTAGMIGESTGSADISTSYTAGFLGLRNSGSKGAGFVNGTLTISDSYTILAAYREAEDGGIDQEAGKLDKPSEGSYASLATKVSDAENVYYFNGSVGAKNAEGSACINDMTTEELNDKLASAGFKVDTRGTQPYRLLGQSLSTYTYPRLSKLTHYGDWETVFQSGALVYFEIYSDASGKLTCGFDGADLEMSLRRDLTIVGDGYGVVFKSGDSTVSEVTVKAGDAEMRIHPTTDAHYEVSVSGVAYSIYPLSTELNNPEQAVSGFYERAAISQTIDGVTASEYYDFNPHFARTVRYVVTENAEASTVPSEIAIRSPRQLYNLSLYYDNGYRAEVPNASYLQERDLSYSAYDWTGYTSETETVTAQEPIGRTKESSFNTTYNGQCYVISDVSFISEDAYYIGAFGYVSSKAKLQNIVLAADSGMSEDAVNYIVQRNKAAQTNETVCYGVLAAYNAGTITNSAASGYYLSGADGTIHGYANASIYFGGLVGYNIGTVNSCETDIPRSRISTYRTTCYAGGFVGKNEGVIFNCYAVGHLEVLADGGSAAAAGFAGENFGSVRQSYCAVALTSSGSGATSYSFSPRNGVASESYYMNAGTYQYVDGFYEFNGDTSVSYGIPKTYAELTEMNTAPAVSSLYHEKTTALSEDETDYPYRAVVKDRDGALVHYGEWQLPPEMGTIGVFYWEHEAGGENQGYRFTYAGTSEGVSLYKTSLCRCHDDGGVIDSYGYGYYYLTGEDDRVSYRTENLATSGTLSGNGRYTAGSCNETVSAALESQVPGYTFIAYTTPSSELTQTDAVLSGLSDYITLMTDRTADTSRVTDGTITLYYEGSDGTHSYTYTVSPFFGNAFSIDTVDGSEVTGNFDILDSNGDGKNFAEAPGSANNSYEVRNIDQLQYLNWNNMTGSCADYLHYDSVAANGWFTVNNAYNSNQVKQAKKAMAFPYLSYAYASSGSATTFDKKNIANLYWMQNHDIDADMPTDNTRLFTPIGSVYDSYYASQQNSSYLYAAFFNGSYRGNSYQIKNVQIYSEGQSVGLFGIVIGAELDSIILYSDKGNVVRTKEEGKGWYNMGALVGMGFTGGTGVSRMPTVGITNCTSAGYTVLDSRSNEGYGGSNIGGLIGQTNLDITGCSACNDIDIRINYSANNRNERVGGLAGSFRGTKMSGCYAGGTISKSDTGTRNKSNRSTVIRISGLIGGYFTRTAGNIGSLYGTLTAKPVVQDCYTYVDFSGVVGSTYTYLCFIWAESEEGLSSSEYPTVTNCYYYRPTKVEGRRRGREVNQTYTNGKAPLTSADVSGCAMEVTYEQLCGLAKITTGNYSGGTILDALNEKGKYSYFDWVTTVDYSGGSIEGKYSFPGGVSCLDGKDYPFPTVLHQTDRTFGNEVNVHYGAWPVVGAYFENGTASLDLFDSMEEDGNAYGSFTLIKNGDASITGTLTKDDFSFDTGGIAEITEVTDSGDKTVLRIRALSEGSVKLTEKNSGASFVLEITAKLTVVLPENEYTLASGEKVEKLTAALCSGNGTDYAANENVSWSAEPSITYSEEGDAGVMNGGLPETKNVFKLTGYGRDATITITAVYTYNGAEYFARNVITIYAPQAAEA